MLGCCCCCCCIARLNSNVAINGFCMIYSHCVWGFGAFCISPRRLLLSQAVPACPTLCFTLLVNLAFVPPSFLLPLRYGTMGQTESSGKELTETKTAAEVAEHKHKRDCWVIIDKVVYDVTDFLEDHPGGASIILDVAGA